MQYTEKSERQRSSPGIEINCDDNSLFAYKCDAKSEGQKSKGFSVEDNRQIKGVKKAAASMKQRTKRAFDQKMDNAKIYMADKAENISKK